MSIFLRFIFILNSLNYGFISDQLTKAAAEETESACKSALAQASIRCQDFEQSSAFEAEEDFGFSPFTGSDIPQDHQHGDGQLCMDVPMWATVWQTPQLLPRLLWALDERNSALQSTQIAQGLYGAGQLGLARPFEERKRCKEKAAATGLDKKCKRTSQSQQGPGEEQRQECPSRSGLPFCAKHYDTLAGARDLICLPISLQQPGSCDTGSSAFSECRCCIRCRAHPGSEGRAPRSLQSHAAHPECSRKGGNDYAEAIDIWLAQNLTCGRHCYEGAQEPQRRQGQASRKVDSPPTGFCQELGATTEAIQRATDQFQQPHQEGQARPRFSPSDLGGAQQEGCGPRGSRSRCQPRGTEPLGRRGHDHGPASAGGASGLCEGGHQGGDHGDLRWEEVPNVPAPKRQRSLEPFAGGPAAPAS